MWPVCSPGTWFLILLLETEGNCWGGGRPLNPSWITIRRKVFKVNSDHVRTPRKSSQVHNLPVALLISSLQYAHDLSVYLTANDGHGASGKPFFGCLLCFEL